MSVRCIRCGTPIQGTAQFCIDCAALKAEEEAHFRATPAQPPGTYRPAWAQSAVPGAARACPACGQTVPAGATFCPNCGGSLAAAQLNYNVTGQRIVAGLIDIGILVGVLVFFFLAFGESNTESGPVRNRQADFYLPTGASFLFILVAYGYYVIMEATTQSTVGKMVFGLKVVKLDGQPYSIGPVLLRNILRVVDGLFFWLVGIIAIAVSQKNQRLGDMAAGTVVVKKS